MSAIVSRRLPRELVAAAIAPVFDIDGEFSQFMRDIGCTPGDAGGAVTFVGTDPLLRSHFRIASSMAIPALQLELVPPRSGRTEPHRDRTFGWTVGETQYLVFLRGGASVGFLTNANVSAGFGNRIPELLPRPRPTPRITAWRDPIP